jgi:hypothetical protein
LGTRVRFGLLVLLGGRGGRVGGRVFFVGEGFGAGGVVAFFTNDGDGGSYGDTLGAVLKLGVSSVLVKIGAWKIEGGGQAWDLIWARSGRRGSLPVKQLASHSLRTMTP